MTTPHRARKRFGQNFLHDARVIEHIVATIHPQRSERMVEIGPGLAALTRPLLAKLDHLSVVELDRDLVARLHLDFAPEHLTVHAADALKFDFGALGPDLRVVGNLPYNISSPLLFHLASFDNIRDMHFMLQKEVVLRMAAAPDTADYGRLSVMLQAQFTVEMCFIVPPTAFTPAPKVDSAIVRLIPLPTEQVAWSNDAAATRFSSVVMQAFSQRRKTLRNTLKGLISAEQMATIGIDPNRRAETLSVTDFAHLTALIPQT